MGVRARCGTPGLALEEATGKLFYSKVLVVATAGAEAAGKSFYMFCTDPPTSCNRRKARLGAQAFLILPDSPLEGFLFSSCLGSERQSPQLLHADQKAQTSCDSSSSLRGPDHAPEGGTWASSLPAV